MKQKYIAREMDANLQFIESEIEVDIDETSDGLVGTGKESKVYDAQMVKDGKEFSVVFKHFNDIGFATATQHLRRRTLLARANVPVPEIFLIIGNKQDGKFIEQGLI